MTYVTSDGRVVQSQPWGVARIMAFVWGVVDFIVGFFQTMIPGFSSNKKASSNFRQGGGGGYWRGGGGGGGGGGSGPRGPPKPPPRRNVHGMQDIQGPPPSCGSCCG